MRILPVYLLISCRFGPWKRTIPFTVKWLTDIVGVWLGIQTGKKWTVKRSTNPGNCPAISFWLGEFNFKLTWSENYLLLIYLVDWTTGLFSFGLQLKRNNWNILVNIKLTYIIFLIHPTEFFLRQPTVIEN